MLINIYTDGGCPKNPGEIGTWGYMIVVNNKIKKIICGLIHENTTNNKMELKAIYEALKFLSFNYTKSKNITILSDSMYFIKCFNNSHKIIANKIEWEQIKHIYITLKQNIHIKWVKGHKDINNIIIDTYMKNLIKAIDNCE